MAQNIVNQPPAFSPDIEAVYFTLGHISLDIADVIAATSAACGFEPEILNGKEPQEGSDVA